MLNALWSCQMSSTASPGLVTSLECRCNILTVSTSDWLYAASVLLVILNALLEVSSHAKCPLPWVTHESGMLLVRNKHSACQMSSAGLLG